MTGAPPSPGVARGLAAIREIIDAWSDLAADPTKWPALTELPPSAHSALSLIWAQVEECEASLSTVQPTTGGGGDREAIARIIDPDKMEIYDREMGAARELEGDGPVAALRKDLRAEHLWLAERAGYDALAKADAIIALRPTPSGETDEAAFEAAYAGANDEACITYPGENEGPLREAFRLGAALTAARRSRPTPDEMAKGEDKGSFDPRIHVPGVWRCAKCQFRLIQSNLNARDGSVTARDKAGEPCPNCGVPLWRVTGREEAEDCLRNEETIWERGPEAGKRYVADEMAAEVGRLRAALNDIAEMCPATQEISTATLMGSIAIQALSSEGPEA